MLKEKNDTPTTSPQAGGDIPLDRLIKAHKINIAKRVQSGEVGLSRELEALLRLEGMLRSNLHPSAASMNGEKDPPTVSSQDKKLPQPSSQPVGDNEEIGIPERLRVKRKYTMSEAAREQRRKAGKANAANGMKAAWKHGRYAKSFIDGAIRPCKSTCPQYPCEIIAEGGTKPGGPCLDKAAVIAAYVAIINAIRHKKLDDFQEIASLTIAQSIQTLNMLLEDIIRDGTTIKREKIDSQGNVIGTEYVHHPALNVLPKMIADLGMTPGEMMITPRAISKQVTEEEGVKTIADLMSRVGETLKRRTENENQK